MSSSNILFIVEGSRAEPTFLKVLWNKFYPGTKYKVYSYNTNLSVLTKEYFAEGEFDEDLDLIKLLKEKGTDIENRNVLDHTYQDIYLVFDLDPRAEIFDAEKIATLMNHFNDSAVNGKLYLSYPMLEAWKDIVSENDPDFEDRFVESTNIPSYKSRINENKYCWDRLRSYSKTDSQVFQKVILHHLKKAEKIQTGMSRTPSLESYNALDLMEVHSKEMNHLLNEGILYTLCTALFLVVEYNPTRFFTDVETANALSETTMREIQR